MTANQSDSTPCCSELSQCTDKPKLSPQEQEMFFKQLAEVEREEAEDETSPPGEEK